MTTVTQHSRVRTRINNIPTTWIEIVETMVPLRPISSQAAYNKAMHVLEILAEKPTMNKAQSDYFEVLSNLVADYEAKNYTIDTSDVSVIDILHSFMEDHDMNASDLGRLIGKDRTLGHKILTGKRKLTTEQIKILAETFKCSTDLFIG